MSFLKNLFGKSEVKGELGYFGLGDWWLSAFSQEERDYFAKAYTYFGAGTSEGDQPLTQGNITSIDHSSIYTLTGMLGALRDKPDYFHLIQPIIQEAGERKDGNFLDLHFLYHILIEVTYRQRERHPNAFDMAVAACEKQISIAPEAAKILKKEHSVAEAQRIFGARLPGHTGYTQLCIIREKEKRFAEALRLAQEAKSQGWAGDWDKRIVRCEKRLQK